MQTEFPDCEGRDDWFFQQDVNAWTSLGYLGAAGVLLWSIARRRLPWVVLALAGATALEGVGSVLYHGGSGEAAQFLHDVPLVAALAFVAGWHAGRLLGAPDRGAVIGCIIGTIVGSVAWRVTPGATTAVMVAAGAVVVVAELVARRRRMVGVWNVALVSMTVIAVAFWLAGTPDSALCEEASPFQSHGLWHLLTALLVLAWVDQAYAAVSPETAPRLFRRAADRVIGLLATGLVHAFHRSVEVVGRDRWPRGRPVLIVANHENGFVDPLMVAAVLGRAPRFLAKAGLWKVAVARPFLAFAGVLPVYRSADGDRPGDNLSVFAACHRELARGAIVAIFPEGTTDDRGGLDRVRSGAARIVLGALPGAPHLAVVPIGMAFESRIETRSRAVVMIGEAIEPVPRRRASPLVDAQEPSFDDVDDLTATIADALAAVSPEFSTRAERDLLRAAARAECIAASGGGEPTFGEVEVVARRLAAAPADARGRVIDAYRRYATQLHLIGVSDRQLQPVATSWPRVALSVLVLVVFGSLLLTVTLFYLPAVLLVLATTGLVKSTATKGTVRVLVGLVAGLATWIVAGILLADGFGAVLTAAVLAVGGAAALLVLAPLTRAASALLTWLRVRDRAGLLPVALNEQAAVVEAVRAALHPPRRDRS